MLLPLLPAGTAGGRKGRAECKRRAIFSAAQCKGASGRRSGAQTSRGALRVIRTVEVDDGPRLRRLRVREARVIAGLCRLSSKGSESCSRARTPDSGRGPRAARAIARASTHHDDRAVIHLVRGRARGHLRRRQPDDAEGRSGVGVTRAKISARARNSAKRSKDARVRDCTRTVRRARARARRAWTWRTARRYEVVNVNLPVIASDQLQVAPWS